MLDAVVATVGVGVVVKAKPMEDAVVAAVGVGGGKMVPASTHWKLAGSSLPPKHCNDFAEGTKPASQAVVHLPPEIMAVPSTHRLPPRGGGAEHIGCDVVCSSGAGAGKLGTAVRFLSDCIQA